MDSWLAKCSVRLFVVGQAKACSSQFSIYCFRSVFVVVSFGFWHAVYVGWSDLKVYVAEASFEWTPGLLSSTSQVLSYWCIVTPSNSYSLLHNNLKITFVCARSLSDFVHFNLTIIKMPEEIFLYVPNNFILVNINSLAYETNQVIVI